MAVCTSGDNAPAVRRHVTDRMSKRLVGYVISGRARLTARSPALFSLPS